VRWRIVNPISRAIVEIREINRRYAKPRIRLSRGTRFALLALRLYLLFLVALLLYRFVITL
jgi:hypothetical protein